MTDMACERAIHLNGFELFHLPRPPQLRYWSSAAFSERSRCGFGVGAAAYGGIWCRAPDKHNEYVSPFVLR